MDGNISSNRFRLDTIFDTAALRSTSSPMHTSQPGLSHRIMIRWVFDSHVATQNERIRCLVNGKWNLETKKKIIQKWDSLGDSQKNPSVGTWMSVVDDGGLKFLKIFHWFFFVCCICSVSLFFTYDAFVPYSQWCSCCVAFGWPKFSLKKLKLLFVLFATLCLMYKSRFLKFIFDRLLWFRRPCPWPWPCLVALFCKDTKRLIKTWHSS